MLTQASLIASDAEFRRLKQHVIEATGLAYYAEREQDLLGHVQHRIRELGLCGAGAYYSLLLSERAGDEELDRLVERLTIGETYFFRHPEVFDALRDRVLPGIIERNRAARRLRIWSAGCSIGAEAYSLSILLKRDLGRPLDGWDISILGTDINRRFLAEARQARFSEWALRGTSEALRLACFMPEDKYWRLRPEYRRGVHFQYHNLVQHQFPSLINNLFAFDLILCRNVLMYFNTDVAGRIINRFHTALVPGGCLIVGHSENNVTQFREYDLLQLPGATLHRRPMEQTPTGATPPEHPTSHQAWAPQAAIVLPLNPTCLRPVEPIRHPAKPPKPPLPPPSSACRISRAAKKDEARRLADEGQLELAVQHCLQVVESDPLDAYAHLLYGLLLEQVGRTVEAREALQRCLYLDRRCALGHYYLGLLHQGHGDTADALRCFRNVLQTLDAEADDVVVAEGEGLTVGELRQLAQTQMEVVSTV